MNMYQLTVRLHLQNDSGSYVPYQNQIGEYALGLAKAAPGNFFLPQMFLTSIGRLNEIVQSSYPFSEHQVDVKDLDIFAYDHAIKAVTLSLYVWNDELIVRDSLCLHKLC